MVAERAAWWTLGAAWGQLTEWESSLLNGRAAWGQLVQLVSSLAALEAAHLQLGDDEGSLLASLMASLIASLMASLIASLMAGLLVSLMASLPTSLLAGLLIMAQWQPARPAAGTEEADVWPRPRFVSSRCAASYGQCALRARGIGAVSLRQR